MNKECRKCHVIKDAAEFQKAPRNKDGLQSYCRKCKCALTAEWYKAHREQFNATRRAWVANNKDKTRAANMKSYARHREDVAEWRRNHKEMVFANVMNYRARKAKNGGRITAQDVERIYASQRGLCVSCRIELNNKFDRDHIVPLSLGGDNSKNNIQLLCAACNRQKRARHPIEFMQSKGFLL